MFDKLHNVKTIIPSRTGSMDFSIREKSKLIGPMYSDNSTNDEILSEKIGKEGTNNVS